MSPLIGADEQPDQHVRELPAFVGIGDSGRSGISEPVDDLLPRGNADSTLAAALRNRMPTGAYLPYYDAFR